MEKTVKTMRQKPRKSRLRSDFIRFVTVTFLAVIVLSIAVIITGVNLRKALLRPTSDKVYLNWAIAGAEENSERPVYGFSMLTLADPNEENPFYSDSADVTKSFVLSRQFFTEDDAVISVTRVYNSPEALSSTGRFWYIFCGAATVFLPMIFALGGVLICGFSFYEKRLKKPIETLINATEKISEQDLDFTVECNQDDELGELCASFEKMRKTLSENNMKMWNMVAQRRQLQTSVAHDLRNPIAIIEGHTEHLKTRVGSGFTDAEMILPVLDNISSAAKRLEHYTDTIRTFNRIEELEIHRELVSFSDVFEEINEDFSVAGSQNGIEIKCVNAVGERVINLDKQALFRILENLVGNAVRFAKSEIRILFVIDKTDLIVSVTDDGCGFSEKILENKNTFAIKKSDGEHSGIGLTVSSILTEKHGGELICENHEGGARVKFTLSVK